MIRPTNRLAVVSMVMGAASFGILPVIGAIVAIVTGHEARAQIRQTGDDGAGMALVGLILGYVNLALAWIGMVLLVILFNVIGASPGPRGFGT